MDEIIKELNKHNDIITVAIVMLFLLGIIYLIKTAIQALITTNLEIIKNQHTKDLEKLKSELETQKQQIEHMNQISQPTYEKLFEKKIDIYQHLIEIQQKYKIKWEKSYQPFEEPNDTKDENIELDFQKIEEEKKTIEGNQLYISNELLDIYEKILTKINEFNSEFDELSIYLHKSKMHDVEYEKYEREERKKIDDKIYKTIKTDLSEFSTILNNDILKIKAKINLDK